MSDETKVDAASMTDEEREEALALAEPMTFSLSVPQTYKTEEVKKTYFAPATSVHDIEGMIGGRHVSTLGWGPIFDNFTNGGLKKGTFVLIGAKGAGYGKTGFLLQLGWDAFALRNDYIAKNKIVKEPLLPALLLSEMSAEAIRCRTLGKLMRLPYEGFSSFPAAMKLFNVDENGAILKFKEVTNFIEREKLNERLSPWQNYLNSTHLNSDTAQRQNTPDYAIRVIVAQMEEMKLRTEKQYPEWKGNVWPVLLLDPIQRFSGGSGNEIDSLSRFSEKLYEYTRDMGWITMATSDTTKGAATSKTDTHGDAFRGSYKLMHSCDIAVKLEALPGHDKENPTPTIALKFDKNRSNVPGDIHFVWHRAVGLFVSENINQHEARKRAERSAAQNGGINKPKNNGTWVKESPTIEEQEKYQAIDKKLERVLTLVENPPEEDESEGF